MTSQTYETLNKAWKQTCRILLGDEVGELKEYEDWLKEYMPAIGKRKSYVSGKDITLAVGGYCRDAKFVSLNEAKEKIAALNINEIKDIDSIIEAVSEKWEYTGNKVLGNSAFVEGSDTVKDSQYILDSASIEKSSYIYASFHCTGSKYIFGSVRVPSGEFNIASVRVTAKRAFDAYWCTYGCSDLYVCANCSGCHDAMFSFNQKNKNYCIGNLQLAKEKYFLLKKKLVSEIKDELKKNKRFPSLFELVPNEQPKQDAIELISKIEKREEGDFKPIDKAFRSTFKVIFKKEIEGIKLYEEWLYQDVPKIREIPTITGSKTYVLRPEFYSIYSKIPEKRMLTFEESGVTAELHLKETDIASFDKIKRKLSEIAYISDEHYAGRYGNLIQCGGGSDNFNIYKNDGARRSEYVALSGFPVDSKYIFGSDRSISSQFCIKCHYVLDSTRCFEADSCEKCSDVYFVHNCEGLSDCMFCFNVKGKRHAIGNAELQPDQYRKIKDALVAQMADEIIKTKALKWDIYGIGCAK